MGVDPYIMNYFLRHMDTLIEKKDITAEPIEMYLEFLKNRKDVNSMIARIQLLGKLGPSSRDKIDSLRPFIES